MKQKSLVTRTPALVLLAVAAALFATPGATQSARPYTPVTQARLENPEPVNWLLFRRTYDANGYSPLDQINATNVKRLTPVWTFATGLREGHQSPPLVNNGVMFFTTPYNHVIALDARTGEQIWRYQRELPEDLVQLHPTNRGVALWGDRVYIATVDAFLVALDARTGAVVWERKIEDYTHGYYCTLAPLAAQGKIMVGVSGGEFGIRGFVAAFDAETGEPIWKTYTIPAPGESGNETWPGDSWKTGGVPVWVTGAYDPKLGLTYWGTGNAGPWFGDARSGDNLFANSVLALDVQPDASSPITSTTGTTRGTGTRSRRRCSSISTAADERSTGSCTRAAMGTCGSSSARRTASGSSTRSPTCATT